MNGIKAEVVSEVIDVAIQVLLGDKIMAEQQRKIRRTIEDVYTKKITIEQAYQSLRFADGDALDRDLGIKPPTP